MKILLLFTFFWVCLPSVFSQSVTLIEKYRSMALKYNHDLKAAEKNIIAGMELEKAARSDRMPQLGANANFQYTGHPAELTLNLPAASRPVTFKGKDLQYGAAVSLIQPVYMGNRILESIRLAQHRQSLFENQAESIRSVICYQTDIQYWNTVARQEMVKITAEFSESIASLVTTIQERVGIGLADPEDLLMAEVKLNEAHYLLLQAQNDFTTGRMAFNSFIGLELDTLTEIEPVIPVFVPEDSLFSGNGSDRPEIRIARDNIKIAESSLQLNDAQYKPQLYLGVDGSYSAPGYNFHQDLDFNYAAYARLSVPIFEWGKRRSEKRAFREQVGVATDQLNKTTDQVNLEVQTARVALQHAIEQVKLTENSLQKANENEQKAMERYREGKNSILEVIDAQTYRQTSQLNYVQAKLMARYQYSGLIKALNAYSSL